MSGLDGYVSHRVDNSRLARGCSVPCFTLPPGQVRRMVDDVLRLVCVLFLVQELRSRNGRRP